MSSDKEVTLKILVSKEQQKILEAKAMSYGFRSKGEFIRFILFSPLDFIEKISDIHNKVCNKHNGKNRME